jgi:adenine-specific DNA-methyltransferase
MLAASRGGAMPTLEFKGKPFVYSHHLSVPFRELVVDSKKSLPAKGQKPSLDDNLIIHGDNLEALKALLPRYAGKVDVIYIDPPYNTGEEAWAYNDNVNSPLMKEWLHKIIDRDDLERHDKWCCMMWPRLVLLRELLSETGGIFVQLDTNESHHLKVMMDEIFGDDNFRNELIVGRGIKNVQSQFKDITRLSAGHDTILFYTKDASRRIPKLNVSLGDEEPGKWDTFWRGTNRKTLRYPLFGQTPDTGQWRWKPSRSKEAIENYSNFQKSGKKDIDEYWKSHLLETGEELDFLRLGPDKVVQYYVAPRGFFLPSDNWIGVRTVGKVTEFQHEKHIDLLTRIIGWIGKSDSIVLDSFAGSGSTGHAVLDLNIREEASRKFILIEFEDYADKLTANRMRRVIEGASDAKHQLFEQGRAGSFTYCKLGDALDLDRFFKGKGAPNYEQVGRYVVYTATGKSVANAPNEPRKDWFVSETSGFRIHVIYKPDLAFMRGNDAALSMPLADEISKSAKGRPALVYAAAKFMAQAELTKRGITFCQLPYSLHRVLGEAPDAS